MSDLGRFFNIDPLAEKFYYNSTYAFSENKVVSHVELEGLEGADFRNTKAIANKLAETNGQSPAQTYKAVRQAQKARPTDTSTPSGKIVNGINNATMGVVGTIASGSYVLATDGIGAAFGGTAALTLSLGEISIGLAQIADGFSQMMNDGEEANPEISKDLQNSSSLPGVVAHGVDSEYADLIDAAGQFAPTPLTGSIIGVGDALQALKTEKTVQNTLNLYDSANDAAGVAEEIVNTVTEDEESSDGG